MQELTISAAWPEKMRAVHSFCLPRMYDRPRDHISDDDVTAISYINKQGGTLFVHFPLGKSGPSLDRASLLSLWPDSFWAEEMAWLTSLATRIKSGPRILYLQKDVLLVEQTDYPPRLPHNSYAHTCIASSVSKV